MPAHQDRLRRFVLDAERAGALEKPVHRRAIEHAGAPVAVGAREADEQLEVDAQRQPPERAVGHGLAPLVKRARPQVLGDEPEHLRADVEAIERVDVEAIENPRRRLDAGRLVAG